MKPNLKTFCKEFGLDHTVFELPVNLLEQEIPFLKVGDELLL